MAVRVGDASITGATVDRWMAVVAKGGEVPKPPAYTACALRLRRQGAREHDRATLRDLCAARYRALRERALAQLITSQWLIQEAAGRGLAPTEREVRAQEARARESVQGQLRALEHGPASAATLELEARAALALARIRRMVIASLPASSPGEVVAYYHQHRADFAVAERRYFFIRSLKSQAAALALKAEVEAGVSFAKVALPEVRSRDETVPPGRAAIDRAIFTARPGVLTGPILLSDVGDHSLFEVTRIDPASYRPLAQVRGVIVGRLRTAGRERALAEFAHAWTAKWAARTRCAAGYVVAQCRRYGGARRTVNPFQPPS